jgi:hypothetical protein
MRYAHDCKNCKPLGEYSDVDLYFCDQDGNNPTVLARFSDHGPDYISGLTFAPTNLALNEAKKRAIEIGYLKGEKSMPKQTIVTPSTIPTIDLSAVAHMDELTQYIRENEDIRDGIASRTRIGMIKACKIDYLYFNTLCINPTYYEPQNFVIIMHSKVRPNSGDIFNLDKAIDICYERFNFMLDVLSGTKQRRSKQVSQKPSKKILKYYNDMRERSMKYFKDCNNFYIYPDMFEYTKEDVDPAFQSLVNDIRGAILKNNA